MFPTVAPEIVVARIARCKSIAYYGVLGAGNLVKAVETICKPG
jgi:hypothetical protein